MTSCAGSTGATSSGAVPYWCQTASSTSAMPGLPRQGLWLGRHFPQAFQQKNRCISVDPRPQTAQSMNPKATA